MVPLGAYILPMLRLTQLISYALPQLVLVSLASYVLSFSFPRLLARPSPFPSFVPHPLSLPHY